MAEIDTMDLFANGLDASAEELLNNLPELDADWSCRWPKMLAEMSDVTAAHLETRQNLDAETARTQAQEWIITLAHHFGGRPLYMPKGDSLKQALRDSAIWQEFTGKNVYELAGKHDMSRTQIYRIIAQQRQLTSNRSQKEFDF